MSVLFAYSLKLSISLAVVYLFYHFVLRKLTFYALNRWYLLGYSCLSFFVAFFNVTPLFQNGLQRYNRAMQFVPVIDFYGAAIPAGKDTVPVGQDECSNWRLCFFILVAGAFVLLIRLIIQYFSFLKIKSKAQLLSENETRIYHVEADIIPFSFGKSIFINKKLHSLDELQEIVRHEFVHVRQNHSLDILWSEFLCIVSWYNPFVWLLRRAIRQNLEFIADSKVLQSGMNKKEYQYLLLKVIGNNHFSIASQFNFSSLKKRIAMMNKMRTARVHILKFLFILPLVAVLLIAFRKKEHGANSSRLQLKNEPLEIAFPSVPVTDDDTIPKTKANKKQVDDRSSDHFEITDKKAVIHLRNGKTEEYDLTDSVQRQNFETNYGKIISVAANADELAPVSAITATGETVTVSGESIEGVVAPATVTTTGETIIIAKAATPMKGSAATVITPVASTKPVKVIDNDVSPGIGDMDILMTITRNTTAGQLEGFKRQLKEKGYELNFDAPTYNTAGILTHISGAIKSQDGQVGNFSATDFDRVILALVKENYRTYFRIEIVDKKKVAI